MRFISKNVAVNVDSAVNLSVWKSRIHDPANKFFKIITIKTYNPTSLHRDALRAGGSGIQIPLTAQFFLPVHAVPDDWPASCAMDTGYVSLGQSNQGVALATYPFQCRGCVCLKLYLFPAPAPRHRHQPQPPHPLVSFMS
jgi:hypothetical protein